MKRTIRPVTIEDDVALITVKTGETAIVDADAFSLVSSMRWWINKGGDGGFSVVGKIGGVRRALSDVVNPPAAGFINDHRDGDPLNNRRTNLRFATCAQNVRNRATRNKTGFKGVGVKKGRFFATIMVDGVAMVTKRFSSAEEAARAYDALARQHFGEFAAVNFPQPGERSGRKAAFEGATL